MLPLACMYNIQAALGKLCKVQKMFLSASQLDHNTRSQWGCVRVCPKIS